MFGFLVEQRIPALQGACLAWGALRDRRRQGNWTSAVPRAAVETRWWCEWVWVYRGPAVEGDGRQALASHWLSLAMETRSRFEWLGLPADQRANSDNNGSGLDACGSGQLTPCSTGSWWHGVDDVSSPRAGLDYEHGHKI